MPAATIDLDKGTAKFDVTIEEGDNFAFTMTLTNGSTAKDLTGHTFGGEIRDRVGGTLVDAFTLAVVGAASDGILKASLTAAETRALSRGGVYDVRIKETSSGDVTRVVEGRVRFSPEVTTTP